ncbi:MAG: hypothetical protein DRO67_09380, partial [Candidatus Asgardarchaeum californiense]
KIDTDAATKSLERLRLENEKLLNLSKSIEERFKVRAQLSKQGINTLKDDIREEISIIQKKEDAAKVIVQDRNKKYLELTKQFKEAKNAIEKQQLFHEIKIEKKRIEDYVTSQTGLNKKIVNLRIELQRKLAILNKFDIVKNKEVDSVKRNTEEIASVQIKSANKVNHEIKKLEVQKTDFYKDEYERRKKIVEEIELAELEKRKKNAEMLKVGATIINESLNKASDERIKLLDKELKASRKHSDALLNIARTRTADETDNIAFEQKKQAELEQKKLREEKKAAQREMLFAGLNTYASKIEQGQKSGQAIGSTITDLTVLSAAIKAIPTFFVGTEDTGTGGSLDNNGGFHAILHDNERVVDKSNNKAMVGLSNSNLADAALMYKQEILVKGSGSNDSNIAILAGLDKLNATLENKTEYLGSDIDNFLPLITKTFKKKGSIVKETKKGW